MKQLGLFFVLGLISFSASAADRNAEFERKAILLGKLAYGTEVHQMKANSSAQDLVVEMAMENSGETKEETLESFSIDSDGSDVAFGDQIGWGTLTLKGAMNVYGMDDDNDDAQKKRNAKETLGVQLIKELAKMGAKFGFTDGTSSYCGISFVGLLVIDEKTGKVFEIALTDSGSCYIP